MALTSSPSTAASTTLYRRARSVIPGGVNSPVRAMRSVGMEAPLFVRRAEGAWIEDVDGNRYVDWVMSWGPLVFGHADPEIVAAVQEAALAGTTFGAPTEAEVLLAEEIAAAIPSVELVRLVSSGTEAAMTAIRLARGFTHRDRVLKFSGCYHGHADALLASAGSGLATLGIPSSPGVPTQATTDTVVSPYNSIDAAAAAVERYGEGLAAIIVEPVAGNMGVVPPQDGFLETLRSLCDACGALLVFDEVITGFRVARGGAQELYGVRPDLTVLGKIAGGGLPLAAFGGRADVMEQLAPSGSVYQAGTLSGNPLATAAALATLRRLRDAAGVRGARDERRTPRGRPPAGGRRRGRLRAAGRRNGDDVLPAGSGPQLRRSGSERHRALRSVLPSHARARRVPGAVAVRGDVRLDRARRGGDRPDGRRGAGLLRLVNESLWDTIAREAAEESVLWADATRPATEREEIAVFSPLGRDGFGLAIESIYEGYLLHYGRPRLFSPADADTGVLLGDYLYAHGLVRLGRARERVRGRGSRRADLALHPAARRARAPRRRTAPPGRPPRRCSGRTTGASSARGRRYGSNGTRSLC